MLKHVIDIGWTSVRLSVRPSACLSHAGTVSKRLNILSCFLHPFILVLCISRSSRNSDGVTPNRGKFSNFQPYLIVSRKRCEIRPYLLWNAHIGNHRRSIELCHSRWPWVTFESHFGDHFLILVPLNIFGTYEATHLKFDRQLQLAYGW